MLKRKLVNMLKMGQNIRIQVWRNGWLEEQYTGIVVEKKFIAPSYEKETMLALQTDSRDRNNEYIKIELIEFEKD